MTIRIRETGEIQTDDQFLRFLRSNNVSVPEGTLPPDVIDAHGADPVFEGAQPTGEAWQHVEPDGVEQVSGQWRTKWKLAPDTEPEDWLDRRKAARKAAVSEILNARLSGGYTHDFGGDIGPKVLQTRNIEDRTNWLTSQASYSAAVAMGAGAVVGAKFRTEDNVNVELSYAAGLQVLLAMASWGADQYGYSWALKDQILAAADEAVLDAINIAAGWPD